MPARRWYRDPVTLAVDTLAAARVTRLVTHDTWPPAVASRAHVTHWLDRHAPGWTHGVTCPWCVAPWAAALIVTVRAVSRRDVTPLLLPLAVGQLVGELADRQVG
ncbi:MAG: DUF1360 domain-containing protein [Pseudonocardia sp.]|nr:DUF1360 domain-containing protein [Pseudonocardia sp.]